MPVASSFTPNILPLYEARLVRRVRLKSGKKASIDTLFGGVSCKLTPSQRRTGMAELRKVRRLEQEAIDDIALFNNALKGVPTGQRQPAFAFFATSERPEVIPLACALFHELPGPDADAVRPLLAAAKLRDLRFLVEE